ICPRGMAGLGFGLPGAIGAAVGRPDADVYLLAGDGGFAYSVQELAVAARFGLRLRAVVINNGSYGWIRHSYKTRFGGWLEQANLPQLCYADVARGFGCPSLRVTDPMEIAPALARASAHDGPFLVAVMASVEESPIATHRTGRGAADPYGAPRALASSAATPG